MKDFRYIILSVLLLAASPISSQDLEDFLEANIQDAGRLSANYISPLIKGVGYGLNNGWYNTAKPHTKGFDLSFTISAAYVPDKDQFTIFDPSQYQDLQLTSPANGMVPTVFGPENIEPNYFIPSSGLSFVGPPGNSLENEVGFNAVPVPMVQLGVGVIPDTDIKLRFLPKTDFGNDVEMNMWGVGVMHKINKYFPGGEGLLMDISVFAGYTHVYSEISLAGNFPGNNQFGAYDVDAWTLEGVVSYDLKILTFYGALGYNKVNSNLDVLGTYEVNSEILVDPIKENFRFGGLKATAGFRVKLAIITLHADYSLNDYNALTAGLGVNVN